MEAKNRSEDRQMAIEIYIQRVTELTQIGKRVLSQEELLKIASELGISDDDIAIAQQQSQAHYIRAQGYHNLGHWDEAIVELEEALTFNPFSLPMLHLLAKCYLGRWQKKHNRQDEEQVKLKIRQCLEIQPDDQESLKLLAQLDKLIDNHRYQIWGVGSLFLVAIGLFIGVVFSSGNSLSNLLARESELQQVNQQLTTEIEMLQEQQIMLSEQFDRENQQQQELINQLQFKIEKLENQINNLNIKQQQLIRRRESPFPSLRPPQSTPETQNSAESQRE